MQLLSIDAAGRHLCLLDAAEVAQLQPNDGEAAWLDAFLRQLAALPLQESMYNSIARAAHAYPDCFVDEDGRAVTLATWAHLVLSGQWRAPGVGPVRRREVREALGVVLSRGRLAMDGRD